MDLQPKTKQLNFNTFVNFTVLGCIVWVGANITEQNHQQSKTNERLAVIEVTNTLKIEQMNRMESEQNRTRAQMSDMQNTTKEMQRTLQDLQDQLTRIKTPK